MLSMFVMAASRSAPSVRADGSLKVPSSVDVLSEAAGIGVGVAGGLVATLDDAGAGAAGGAGVDAAAGAGVEGAFEGVEAEDELAGTTLGFAYDEWIIWDV